MPTAGKLTAAILFAGLLYLTAELFKSAMPPETAFGRFSYLCAGIGMICGWLISGPRVRRGTAEALTNGLQTSITAAFFCLMLFCIYLMLKMALRKLYDGPFDAIMGVFELMFENGQLMIQTDVLVAILVGGPLAGWLTDRVGRRWS
ncbi:TrgA family protein [Gemmobacter denitrificans]|uniref:TrgA family protein n=1 Tax=Gemmobacter denitrificans TaxID=3123040 RepID=A0ABU8BXM9_9RHOB